MMSETLHFLTLTTGHVAMSPRSEVEDDVIERILASLAGDGRMGNGWRVEHHIDRDFALFRILVDGVMLTQSVVCYGAAAANVAWTAILSSPAIDETGMVPGQMMPAHPPWMATVLDANVGKLPLHASTRDLMMTLGDAGRCIGWALVERARRLRAN